MREIIPHWHPPCYALVGGFVDAGNVNNLIKQYFIV
jgi:hypothetical protein